MRNIKTEQVSKNPIVYLKQLKGRKHLIVGNHDRKLLKNPESQMYFVEIVDMKMRPINIYLKLKMLTMWAWIL